MPESDHYAVLQVERDAEPEVIEAAYRALARKYHPDVNRAGDAAERMRRLNESYRVLHDAAARLAYDAASLPARSVARPAAEQSPAPVPTSDRPVDLFGAAVADTWRRMQRTRRARTLRRAAAAPSAEAAPHSGVPRSRRSLAPMLGMVGALGTGVVVGAVGARFAGGSDAALAAYWRQAAAVRAAVEEARLPVTLAVGNAAAGPAVTYAAAVANTPFGPLATQLIAALENAAGQLRRVQGVPADAEAYHFAQLDDWREERDLRVAQRDAIVSRNADLWAQSVDREVAWRASPAHQKTEAVAWQLAARVAGSAG